MRTLELEHCPGCSSRSARSFTLDGEHELRRCAECRLVYAARYADPDVVYVDGYYTGGAGEFGIDVRGESFQRYLLRVGNSRMRAIERVTRVRSGSILDVGAGTGEVLAAARERGWHTQGVEPAESSALIARERGLDVEVAMLEEAGLPRGNYDVVSAFHVLEHVPDSLAFLRSVARWCRPGGHVVIEVPNFNSSARRRNGGGWMHLRPLEHLVHFEPATLRRTVERAGLKPVLMRTPMYLGPPQNLNHALDDLARHGGFRRLLQPLSRPALEEGPNVRYPTRAGWAVIRAMEALHDRAGAGSVVFCVARVPAQG